MKSQLFIFIVSLSLLFGNEIQAQSLSPGMDAVVTLYGQPDAINAGTVAYVKTVGDQFGAPHHANWVPPSISPAITNWTVDYLGQIFGIAIDDAGNVYFAATAMYWGGSGNAQRLADLNPSTSGAGGMGYHVSGGPAGIYKAASANLNTITVLTGSVPSGGGTGTSTLPNTGYGVGNIAYAKIIDKLYTSNLEDGAIYCIDPATGLITDVYDPFGADASGVQIAGYGERIFGLAVNYEVGETRLYYAVLMNDHQSDIWSVRLNSTTGAFVPATNSVEINLPVSSPRTYVSDIAFSSRGEMLVAEKGAPHNANVYQYFGKHNAWSLPMQLYMSALMGGHNSAGGVDYGYSTKSPDTTNRQFYCDTLIWSQSNAIAEPTGPWLAYGLLSHPLNGYVNPADYLSEAYIVNLRGDVTVNGLTQKGSFGDVECFDWECPVDHPDICSKINARLIKIDSGDCCYMLQVSNHYRDDYFNRIAITATGLAIDDVSKDISNTWSNISYQSPTQVVFAKRFMVDGLPLDGAGGYQSLGTLCFSGTGPGSITVDFIGNPPQYDTVCKKIVEFEGCSVPVDTSCVSVIDIKAECDSGVVKMKFRIHNNSAFTMRGLTLYSQNPDVNPAPKFISIPDLLPGQTSPSYYETTLIVTNNASSACFFIAACDQNTTPGIAGPYPNWCCMDSIPYCIDIPTCNPCEGISFTTKKTDPSDCCYDITLSSNYINSNIAYLEFTGIGGTQFAVFTGWSISGGVTSSYIKIKAPGGGVSSGTYPDFASFCLTGTSVPPYTVLVNIIDAKGVQLCTDTLTFEECILVDPTCANIINDSLYCSGDKIKYRFSVKNNAPFPLWQVDFHTTGITLDVNHVQLTSPIAPGSTGGPFTVTIDSMDTNLDRFCMYLTGHNGIYDPITGLAATECCTDSLGVICLPMIQCGGCDTTICCDFENMIIPNGITPNEDGFNDQFEILNSTCCDYISITVYNQWGNVEYQNEDYKNDWKGVNQSGKKLVQGTYFIVLKLPTGNQKAMYIDVRY
ncbi:MAG: gliding motility-associated C-terminal domain-containing protein [Bacteroidales bacterium]|nr:gliding motility-associated C-terminal domain-containing protein [Bacteroidales bacterium]